MYHVADREQINKMTWNVFYCSMLSEFLFVSPGEKKPDKIRCKLSGCDTQEFYTRLIDSLPNRQKI